MHLLTPMSSELVGIEILIPTLFPIGRPITSVPDQQLLDVKQNRLSKWQESAKLSERIYTL